MSTPPAKRRCCNGLPGVDNSFRLMISEAPSPHEIVRLIWPARDCRHSPAATSQERDRHRTNAAHSAGHDDGSSVGRQAEPLQRHQAKHGCDARRSDGHGLLGRETVGQRDESVPGNSRLLGETSVMRFAEPAAACHDEVARSEVGVRRGGDAAGKINAGNHGNRCMMGPLP